MYTIIRNLEKCSLNAFQIMNIEIIVGVPNSYTIFQLGHNERVIEANKGDIQEIV